jgi:hypothetical protein
MTVMEAINTIDNLKHNTYSQRDKRMWLSRLDGMVKRLIIDTHEGGENIPFVPYVDETPGDTVMLVPAPFDEIYLRWLEAQIDYCNGEIIRYNNSMAMFNSSWESFRNYYNANHMPLQRGMKFF